MKKTVILTVGAPGSGKSTWAKEEARDSKLKTIVLTRDDMRMMLVGGGIYKYTREREKQVTTFMRECLISALNDSITHRIIIADTNLNPETRKLFEDIVDHYQEVNIEYKVFELSWPDLLKRNEKRGEKSVPIQVLRDMYKNMQIFQGKHKEYIPNLNLRKAVIFDIDGTIADNSSRGPFAYSKCLDDKPIDWVIKILKNYESMGYAIICLSGRNSGTPNEPYFYKDLTQAWLDKHNINNTVLLMRKAEDFRKDDIIKEEIFWNNIANEYNVECAYDDRSQVVEMWRRIGVNCLQVNHGDF